MGNAESHQGVSSTEKAVLEAVTRGDTDALIQAMKREPRVLYAHSKDGQNVWHFAAQSGHIQVIELLAKSVQDMASQGMDHKPPGPLPLPLNKLKHAADNVRSGVNKVVNKAANQLAVDLPTLMGKDLSINAQTRKGVTPLMVAVSEGRPDVVETLLSYGADPALGDFDGNNAVHLAALKGEVKVLEQLLDAEGEVENVNDSLVNSPNKVGLTPLHFAAWANQNKEVVKLLLRRGANYATQTQADSLDVVSCNGGSTALHVAAMRGSVDVIKLIMKMYTGLREQAEEEGEDQQSPAYVDPRTLTDRYGHTPQKVAMDCGKTDVVKLLDPQEKTKRKGKTAAGSTGVAQEALISVGNPDNPDGHDLSSLTLKTTSQKPRGSSYTYCQPPREYVCPITNDVMQDPVSACDGRSYERTAILMWMELGNRTFPGGYAQITTTDLVDNTQLKEKITEWRQQQEV